MVHIPMEKVDVSDHVKELEISGFSKFNNERVEPFHLGLNNVNPVLKDLIEIVFGLGHGDDI